MAQPSVPSVIRETVDVTYVDRGQLAKIVRLRSAPSQRARDAVVRAASRRRGQ